MSFSDQQISKWATDYERELCARSDFICDRISLEVIAARSEYQLPNYITNIRMVLCKGKEVKAKGFQASLFTGDTPFSTVGASPYEYVVSGKGLRIIKFYPTPAEAISEVSGELFSINADTNGLIIEFYRTPSSTVKLPEWCRRYLLKDYICWKAFRNEGPDQDIRSANYYESRLSENAAYISLIKNNMHQGYVNILGTDNNQSRSLPGKPVLPSNFGTVIPY